MTEPVFDPSKFEGVGKVVAAPEPMTPQGSDDFTFSPDAYLKHQERQVEKRKDRLIDLRNLPDGPVKAWSFSGLSNFERCPHAIKLSKVDKMPDPAGPAADRGNMVHQGCEDFIQGKTDKLCKEAAKHFEPMLKEVRDLYNTGAVEIEENWGFTKDWVPTGWAEDDTWNRMKLDVIIHESKTSAKIIDWKTGRKFGNEIKHTQQLQLYGIGAFMRYPELEFVEGKMVYLDKNDVLPSTYSREEAMEFIDKWTLRGLKMTTATVFDPKPSEFACRWCPHAKVQEGFDAPACSHAFTGV